jgi:hypothetical protein
MQVLGACRARGDRRRVQGRISGEGAVVVVGGFLIGSHRLIVGGATLINVCCLLHNCLIDLRVLIPIALNSFICFSTAFA